jgi:hypothetical protein
MLVSVLAAPYSWFFDQCVLLPALLNSAYRATSRTAVSVLFLASSAVIVLILFGIPAHSAVYLWFAPTWLAWHLWATAKPPITFSRQKCKRRSATRGRGDDDLESLTASES